MVWTEEERATSYWQQCNLKKDSEKTKDGKERVKNKNNLTIAVSSR
jgi:hypothetical protein